MEKSTSIQIQNPGQQVGYLQERLRSNKTPLGLFLGAGCPLAIRTGPGGKDPLIPDIAGMTVIVRRKLTEKPANKLLLDVVDKHFGEDCRSDTTVEDILSHVRGLRSIVGKGKARDLSAIDLDTLDTEICKIIHELADKHLPGSDTPYHRIASWADSIPREKGVEVFTTNYDLLMEQAFEDRRVPYFDGFAGVRQPFFDLRSMEEETLPPRWARLWKLHGSINWHKIDGKGVFRATTTPDGSSRRVIHPSHLKYEESRRMPYLAMIDRLRAFLKNPTATLVLCGYSFRDDHLNETIVQGLQGMQTAIAFAVLFNGMADYTKAVTLARQCMNLTLLARDGAVIGGRECQWPQKDAEDIAEEDGKWVKWALIDPANGNGKRKAELLLGDFDVLGQFLWHLVGQAKLPKGASNAT